MASIPHFSPPQSTSITTKFLTFTSNTSLSSNLFFFKTTRKSHSLSIKSVASDQQLQESVPQQGLSSESPISFTSDSDSIASSIKYHAEFTPAFSPHKFELPKAYLATAESVRDALIINWNKTYDYYHNMNMKQAYYLSMEFLQGRALLNAIGNLELSGPYAEALSKLGYKLENVAKQVRSWNITCG